MRTIGATLTVLVVTGLGIWAVLPKDGGRPLAGKGQRISGGPPLISESGRTGAISLPAAEHSPPIADLLFFDYDEGTWRTLEQLGGFASAISPDGSTVAGGDGEIVLYDAKTSVERSRVRDSSGWQPLRFSQDGSRLIATRADRESLVIWDLTTNTMAFKRVFPDRIEGACLSTDNTLLACNIEKSTIIYELNAPTAEHKIGKGDFFRRGGPVFSSNGKLLAFADVNSVHVWDVEKSKMLLSLPQSGWFSRVVFSADGRIVAAIEMVEPVGPNPRKVALEPAGLRLWDIEKRRTALIPYGEREWPCFSPDGKGLMLLSLAEPTKRLVPFPKDSEWQDFK